MTKEKKTPLSHNLTFIYYLCSDFNTYKNEEIHYIYIIIINNNHFL